MVHDDSELNEVFDFVTSSSWILGQDENDEKKQEIKQLEKVEPDLNYILLLDKLDILST